MKNLNPVVRLLAGCSVMTLAMQAHAQNAAAGAQTTVSPNAAQPASAPPPMDAQTAQDIIVTGSRVITNGNNSPTPVTVVAVDDLLRTRPTTIAEALNDLPVFSGSRGQFSNPNGGTSNNVGGGNSAGNNLNLRNMGSARTLILFDGHRVPPTNVNGYVDVDMIPQQLLQRVDVVTGGASAVYGSDAVIGVVNFVTDRHFNGIKANVQSGITQDGDDGAIDAGLAAGADLFGGRGHVEVSYEHRDDKGVPFRSSRDTDHKTYTVQGGGTTANPYYLTPFARITSSTFGGLITSGALSGMTFNQNGVLSPFAHGTASGASCCELGGDGYYFDSSLKASLKSNQLFGRFDYDLTDTTHFYVETAWNDKDNQVYTTWLNLTGVTISSADPYLATVYQQQLAAAKQTTFKFSKQIADAERNAPVTNERQKFINAGLDGKLFDGFKWSLGGVYSDARLKLTNTNINNGRLYAALDAVTNPANGQIVCNTSLAANTPYAGCVPLNPFGPTSDMKQAIDYITQRTHLIAYTKIADITGAVNGSPFSTWAGPVNFAVSGEWRKITYHADSDAQPTDTLSCAGLRFNCTATSILWNSSIASRSKVEQQVKEGAVEVDIPLLKDSVIAQSFNINGAARYTSYDTSGDYWTWKVGLDWHFSDAIRLRGTRSRDIRAPTLDDLYSPSSFTLSTFADTLTNTNPTNVKIVSGGNPNLTAEIGDTWTGGVVLKPAFLPNFSFAVDYFDIRVTNAILSVVAQQPTFQRACYQSGGTSPYCALQVRPNGFTDTSPSNAVTQVTNTVINIAEQHTNGVDMELNYAHHLFARPASLRLLATYQPHLKYIQPGVATLDQAGVAFGNNGGQAVPVWRMTGLLRFMPAQNFSVDVLTRWRSALKLSGDDTLVTIGPKVPAASFTNLTLNYRLQKGPTKGDIFLNITNLFDKSPPPAAFYASQNNPGVSQGFVMGDDPLGRAFTVGIRVRM